MVKKKILVFIDWYYPAYKAGGPVKSVAGIVRRLAGEFDFLIVTSDNDLGEPLASNIVRDQWTAGPEGEKVFYASKMSLDIAKKLIADTQPDAIYLNSLFSVSYSIFPLLASGTHKVILAPRGMLGKDALKLKAFKKSVFLLAFKVLGLHKKVLWHTSTPQEAREVKNVFGHEVRCLSAMDLPPALELMSAKNRSEGEPLKLVFLSRIAEKKNLLFAIRCLRESGIKAVYDIYGPIDEADYWAKCIKEAKTLPPGTTFNYRGTIPGHKATAVLAEYDFFFMPTLHENYGHAITESFAAGTPVIISQFTPWHHLAAKNTGFDLPLERKVIAKVLQKMALLTPGEYRRMSEACIAYAADVRGGADAIRDNIALFDA